MTLDDDTIAALGFGVPWPEYETRFAAWLVRAGVKWKRDKREQRNACRERGAVHVSDRGAAERAKKRRERLRAQPSLAAAERAKNTERQRQRRAAARLERGA